MEPVNITVTEASPDVNLQASETQELVTVQASANIDIVIVELLLQRPDVVNIIVDDSPDTVLIVVREAKDGRDGTDGTDGQDGADVDPATTQKLELLNRFKTGYGRYQEFVTTGNEVTQINTWSAPDKLLKLFTENITYVSGNPTQIVVTDEVTGAVLTTVFTYFSGEIINITDTLS